MVLSCRVTREQRSTIPSQNHEGYYVPLSIRTIGHGAYFTNTVEPGYNDISLRDTSPIASDIL